MSDNMNKCDISKCKASCCHNVPLTKFVLFSNKKKIVTPYIDLVFGGMDNDGRECFIPVTSTKHAKNKCPFLRDDCKCNIYDKRPWICRSFGEPKNGHKKFLHCGYLDGKDYNNVLENDNDTDIYISELMTELLSGGIKNDKH